MMKSVFEKQGILLSIAAERRNRKQMKRKFYYSLVWSFWLGLSC